MGNRVIAQEKTGTVGLLAGKASGGRLEQDISCPRPDGSDRACGTGGATASAKPAIWLSILIPFYNVEPYLRACVESILSQVDDPGVEVILLDDASTDGSLALAERLCGEYGPATRPVIRPVIRLVQHDDNRGLSAARNRLIAAAQGEYLWFVDSDDMLLPGAVAGLRAIVTGCAPDIVLCDYEREGKVLASFRGPAGTLEHDRRALIRGVFASRRMHVWSKISRRALWDEGPRFPVGKYFEDAATTPWLLLRAASFFYAAQPWLYYRVRADSVMGQVSRTKGLFDDRKNDDLAEALEGYADAVMRALPDIDPETLFRMAHFCAKEYTKIAFRLLRARLFRDDRASIARRIARYCAMMQACSPLSFDALAKAYLRRMMPGKWIVLRLFLMLAGPVRIKAD